MNLENLKDFIPLQETISGLATPSWSGMQTLVKPLLKCRDLACDVEPTSLQNYKDLPMKLKVKYLFPTSSSGTNL